MKKPNYAAMFTLRSDGRYQGYWHEPSTRGKGKRHYIYDRDPKRLFERIRAKENETPAPLTFEAALDAWEAKHRERCGNKTAETYKAPIQRVRDQFAGMDAEEVTAQDVQAFLADLGKKGYAKRTVQMHRDILNMVFNNAIVENGLLVAHTINCARCFTPFSPFCREASPRCGAASGRSTRPSCPSARP